MSSEPTGGLAAPSDRPLTYGAGPCLNRPMTSTTYVIKSRSTRPFALVTFLRGPAEGDYGHRPIVGVELAGYAASDGPAVRRRATRLGARIVPIDRAAGRIRVTVEDGRKVTEPAR